MPTFISPTMDIIRTDTMAHNAANAVIALPAGTWYLVSVTTVASNTTIQLAITDATPTTFRAAAVMTTAGAIDVSDAPDTAVVGPITLNTSGASGNLTFLKMTFVSSTGRTLTVT